MQVQKSKAGPNEILAVAARLFAERGYSNVSIRDVCKEAKTSAPMIYYYFKDKKGLFRAAVSEKLSLRAVHLPTPGDLRDEGRPEGGRFLRQGVPRRVPGGRLRPGPLHEGDRKARQQERRRS